MNMKYLKGVTLLGVLCALLMPHHVDAQTYVRYVNPEDLLTEVVYSDSVLTSITLPRGVARLDDYPVFNAAAEELSRVLSDSSKELLEVFVCGSASPDGLWENNVNLSQARTEAGAEHIREVAGIPEDMIRKVSLNEDWDRLYELVEASDIPYKSQVLEIIRTQVWGERKNALKNLDDGKVWEILENDFFPKLRCIRFAIYCKWDPSKPYLSRPDTVFVRDTVYLQTETYYLGDSETVTGNSEEESVPAAQKKYIYIPTTWRMALKTNLAADAVLPGNLGLEFQLSDRFSLDVMGGYSQWNTVFPCIDTKVYGITPELRFYPKDAIRKGHFFGLHGNAVWYTTKWADGLIYQNISNEKPAWSVGLTYGYLLGFGKNDRWGLEFYAGAGYGTYHQKVGQWNEVDQEWQLVDNHLKRHFGLTRFGINLTYRFDIKKLNVYYDE